MCTNLGKTEAGCVRHTGLEKIKNVGRFERKTEM